MRFPLTFLPLITAALLVVACDEQRAARLEEGVSTEADVRREFGEPVQITERADGSKVLSYPRQPEGATNYEIDIGPEDGRVKKVFEVMFDGQHKVLATAITDDERETLPAR